MSRVDYNKLKAKYNCERLWSWSRYTKYKTSKYEYFLKYVLKEKGDRHSIYAELGGLSHDIIEKFYRNEIKYEDMIDLFESGLKSLQDKGLKYDRSNNMKNDKIASKYEACMREFFKNHTILNQKLHLEKLIIIKINNFVFQGYIDAVHKENGKVYITDWKTSSIYTGKKIDKEKGQLLLYAEGLRQNGFPIEDIVIRWNFLKYVDISYRLKNGNLKTTTSTRHNWASTLISRVKMDLKDLQWTDEDIDVAIQTMISENSLKSLPKSVQDNYVVEDCYVEIDFTSADLKELCENIHNTLIDIHKCEAEYSKTKDDNVFYDDLEKISEDSYYFANLCEYSQYKHKPYAEYLQSLSFEPIKELDDDLKWMEELGLL